MSPPPEEPGRDDEPEELLESRRRQPVRRSRLVLGTVAVAALVVGVVVLTRDDGGEGTTAAPASSSASPTRAGTPTVRASSVPRVVCLDVGDSALNCGVSAALPSSVSAAVRTVLATAVLVSATTVTGRDGRVFSRRALFDATGRTSLRVRISPATTQRTSSGTGDGSVEYGTDVGRRHVEISVRAQPGTATPSVADLRRLALDPRLFALT